MDGYKEFVKRRYKIKNNPKINQGKNVISPFSN